MRKAIKKLPVKKAAPKKVIKKQKPEKAITLTPEFTGPSTKPLQLKSFGEMCEPMVISIHNASDSKKTWNLFGYNEFQNKKNFGNEDCIILKGEGAVDYSHYFNKFSSEKGSMLKLRLQSSCSGNLEGTIYFHRYNVGKAVYTRRESSVAALLDPFQFQSGIIDTKPWKSKAKLSSERYISGTIHAHSTITVSIYLASKTKKELPTIEIRRATPSDVLFQVNDPKTKKSVFSIKADKTGTKAIQIQDADKYIKGKIPKILREAIGNNRKKSPVKKQKVAAKKILTSRKISLFKTRPNKDYF